MTSQLTRNKSSTYSSMLYVDICINIYKYKGDILLQNESSVFNKIRNGKIQCHSRIKILYILFIKINIQIMNYECKI